MADKSNQNMDKYFTPVRKEKRERSQSSPETSLSAAKRTTSTIEDQDILGNMAVIMGKLLDEKLQIVAKKEDLESLTKEMKRLVQENISLKNEVNHLKKEISQVNERVTSLEDRARRNNVIFKGLKYNASEDCRKLVEGFCKNVLKCEKEIVVNRAHTLGQNRNNAPVIAHIPRDEDVDCVFKNVKKLRDTGYIVHRDFSFETRRKRGKLARLKKEISRVVGDKRMAIVVDRLVVEGTWFTLTDNMQLRCGQMDGAEKLKQMFNYDFTRILEDAVKDNKNDE
ncbi:hypothetical protein LSTR_LSTR012954 [Laodelphax striatellus]|uniref:Uncharacterized protein n=1 Tax=Laodelphax striatellus TaxID=195883 RepID=A0A482X5E7_LAOST|nr:hypothetical protein LSTR_LSTR006307 [Laodelphax striatellus]RZF44132.1 hypothetical protein LSTR_LSTR012954 [Laodelphax striatellus]